MNWFFVKHGREAPAFNMAFDEALLNYAGEIGVPILRFYGWSEAAASFGYFQPYEQIAGWTGLRPLIRRPTGGGLVSHLDDWTYSFVAPPEHWWHQLRAEESYQKLHQWVSDSFAGMRLQTELAPCAAKEAAGRCFAGPEKFDLLFGGKKIAGAAQRRNKFGLLAQGSIQARPAGLRREDWEQGMLRSGAILFGGEGEEFVPSPEFHKLVGTLQVEKYNLNEYNKKK